MSPPPALPTRVARMGDDDHAYFGYRIFRDLVGRETCLGMLVLSITGRRASPETSLETVARR